MSITSEPKPAGLAYSAVIDLASDGEFIDEAVFLKRVKMSRRTLFAWRENGIIPYIRPPGTRRILYHWPSVQQALLRQQRGGAE